MKQELNLLQYIQRRDNHPLPSMAARFATQYQSWEVSGSEKDFVSWWYDRIEDGDVEFIQNWNIKTRTKYLIGYDIMDFEDGSIAIRRDYKVGQRKREWLVAE